MFTEKESLLVLSELALDGMGKLTIREAIHKLIEERPDIIKAQEVRDLAKENYKKGGSAVYECYELDQIELSIAMGKFTEDHWMEDFRQYEAVYQDQTGWASRE